VIKLTITDNDKIITKRHIESLGGNRFGVYDLTTGNSWVIEFAFNQGGHNALAKAALKKPTAGIIRSEKHNVR